MTEIAASLPTEQFEYLQGLQTDFADAELRQARADGTPPASYVDLYFLLNESRKLFSVAAKNSLKPENVVPHTELGEAIKVVLKTDSPAKGMAGDCCSDSEKYLIESLDPETVHDDSRLSPVIVTLGDEPIGIIKQRKLKSLHGLASVPQAGVYEGVISRPVLDFQVSELPPSNEAWAMELGDTTANPFRFSILGIHKGLRSDIRYTDRHAVVREYDLTDILATTHKLLETARPLSTSGQPL